jgi:hypothetical protein
MLKVMDADHLAKARAHADSCGAQVREQFEEQIAFLENYQGGVCLCELHKDWAPHSFRFVLLGRENEHGERRRMFDGLLAYYGPHENGVGMPQLSVTLSPSETPHWTINT